MTKNLLGVISVSAALLAAPLAASAADMGVPYTKAPMPRPVVSWTGCYVDGGVGYGMFNQDESVTGPGLATAKVTDGGRGWLGRVGGGCDYQLGGSLSNWVVGAFGDYDFENIHGWNDLGSLGETGNEKQNSAWAVGGRLGYLVTPNLLTYTDGGYTEARFNGVSFSSVAGGPTLNTIPSHTYHGWFLGGGTEYALNFSWLPIHGLFWRNEYRYSSFDSAVLPISFAGGGATGASLNATKYEQTITSSLVWRFNWQ
jgi:outer membrane immunogenic protein